MTSPVDTSVKYFHSDMLNAPALTGAAGTLITLLDACLKDGFDIKTLVSLTVVGGVATATWTGTHSALPESVVFIAGVTGTLVALNGEQKVVSKPGSTSITFATAAPDGTAAGTITMKMAPLGWLKPFVSGSVAAYKSADVASAGFLLRVDDTAATFARVRGYESMTDVNTGAGLFPLDVQISGGGYWPKSNAAGSTAIPWQIFGDGRMFYITTAPARTSGPGYLNGNVRGFGEGLASKPGGDPYFTLLSCSATSVVDDMWDGDFGQTQARIYSPRLYTGIGSAVAQSTRAYTGAGGFSGFTTTLGSFPSSIDGSLFLSRKYVSIDGNSPRGDLPGFLHIPQSLVYDSIKHKDMVPGSGSLAGRKLMAFPTGGAVAFASGVTTTATNAAVALMDITGPWRS